MTEKESKAGIQKPHLYNLLTNAKADISICNFVKTQSLNENKIDSSDDRIEFTSEQAIQEMLYARTFTTSAWGKLYRKILFDKVEYGEATRKMRAFLQDPKPELLHHQKFFENGTAERAKESGTEQNYNMIDGCVNNVPKKPRRIGGRWSVLDRLHIKQAERRQKDNAPQQEQERSRKS